MMGRELSVEELDTYSRQIVLKDISYEGQRKIRGGRVCVIGVGGLGSTIVTQLARMGIGFLRIVDRDVVERSDLHRQVVYSVKDLGMPKVEATENRIGEINPNVEVETLPLSVNDHNAESIVKDVDVVVDGLDSFRARRIVNRACVKLSVPYVFGSAVEMFGNASTIIPRETPCLDCFLPRQEPSATCATVGVHPSLVSIIASIEVSEAVKIITGKEPSLKNRLLFFDLRNMFLETVEIKRSDSCETCSQPKAFLGKENVDEFHVEEACSTRGISYYVVSPTRIFELNLQQELQDEYVKVKKRHRLSTMFLLNDEIEVHLLKSGVGIVRGARDKSDALQKYMRVFNLLSH
ncbi:MAG: HesA/MoeB/ThiF family protein [Candidatus Brockarchaeota archaeon]|nr:HesA/MoeB/ThiF family protein [Candidatus Brockarchaeota archaeon]